MHASVDKMKNSRSASYVPMEIGSARVSDLVMG